jgi:hypothetical protein
LITDLLARLIFLYSVVVIILSKQIVPQSPFPGLYKHKAIKEANSAPLIQLILLSKKLFFLFVPVLSQSFLSFMRRHFMSFPFLSTWHNFVLSLLSLNTKPYVFFSHSAS